MVAAAWSLPFSLNVNVISDLGNTSCGTYGGMPVCSPLHELMNVSFVVLGLSVIIGGALMAASLPRRTTAFYALATYAATGIGTVLVGFFPENSVSPIHVAAAALPFAIGNLSLVALGLREGFGGRRLRTYTVMTGAVAFIALGFFQAGLYGVLGRGGMERLVAYPQTIWMIVVGLGFVWQTVRMRQHKIDSAVI